MGGYKLKIKNEKLRSLIHLRDILKCLLFYINKIGFLCQRISGRDSILLKIPILRFCLRSPANAIVTVE